MHLLLTVLAAGYGAVLGTLLPRAAYRLAVEPEEAWRARCPEGHPLPGWAGRARCRECGGAAYGKGAVRPAAVGAMVCAALAYTVGARPELAVWLLMAPLALLLTLVDAAVHRLPDVLTLPLAGGTALLLGLAALLPRAGGDWPRALLGGAVLAAFYFVLFLLGSSFGPHGGLGFGDVKLAGAVGVALGWYGWGVLVLGAFCAVACSAVWAFYLLVVRRAGRKAELAMGPFMVAGTLAGVLLGGLAG